MALSDEDKNDLGTFLDGWLGQAADHIKEVMKTGGNPPAPPKVDPPADPPKDAPTPKNDPPKGPKPSRKWFGERAD